MDDVVIQADVLTKVYHMGEVEVQALRGVSLEVKRGEVVAIMGPSGSGKSTLMHIIGCLDRPTSGQYILDGEEVAGLSDDQLASIRNRKIGFVFQSFNLMQRVSALANVALPLEYARRSDEGRGRAESALRAVGLESRMKHRPSELSGGEQQRVAVARALVNEPAILLADEPTGNLDSKTSEEIMSLFNEIHRNGNTIILVTHEESIARHARRIIRLLDGHIEFDRINEQTETLAH